MASLATDAPLVRVSRVSKHFGEGPSRVDALREVSIDVHRGEVVALLGPSGSGKSTLLNVIGCITDPSAGSLELDGELVFNSRWLRSNLRRLRLDKIGFIFQSHNLLPFLNATDNVALVLLDGKDAQIWRDPHAAAFSPWVTCLGEHPISSHLVIAHIRHATRGVISLANTQPFVRELWGRVHVFAHNGMLPGLAPQPQAARFQAIGETDSEVAFCNFMDRIAKAEGSAGSIRAEFAATSRLLRSLGPANLLYASGGRLLVHADRRTQASGEIAPPGLWVLERTCSLAPAEMTSGAGVEVQGNALKVMLIASVPLTEDVWRPLARGTILEVVDGAVVTEQLRG